LATVSAVVSRTQDASGSTGDFVAALQGRIHSMSRTHQLLSGRLWNGVPLSDLVNRELAPYATGANTMIEGPEVTLSAKATGLGSLAALGGRGNRAPNWYRLARRGWAPYPDLLHIRVWNGDHSRSRSLRTGGKG
jgi:hypothetical protein